MESPEGGMPEMDGVRAEEANIGEVKVEEPIIEEIEIGGVEDNAVAIPEPSTAPPARMGKLEFKDIPLDMKRMVLSYVRREF
jgi:hypothetical protein